MSRPKPKILLEYTDREKGKQEQVLACDAIFAVFYNNKPINLRSKDWLRDQPGPTYKKVSFSNPGHAFNLAEKLNKLYKTDKFQVFMFKDGIKVEENAL